jgi:2-oxoglutarate/2-oxoacid ferredoxin oxidoreductase subunit alpha
VIKSVEEKERVIVRFAGDSGDGMQLAGTRFTDATAVLGNDLVTLPDFPAEIRAPAGTLHGVSAFQIHFASRDILTPGDHPNVLVAMNPAALRVNLESVERGGIVIANDDAFTDANLRKAGYASNPLDDGTLSEYQVFRVPMTSITVRATEDIEGVTTRTAGRSKNFFALGLVSWMFGRPTDVSVRRRSPPSLRCETPTWPHFAPATTSARRLSCSPFTTRSSLPPPSRAPTETSTALPRWRSGW